MITETTSTKIIFFSAGTLTVGLTQANMGYVILGIVGLMFSLANYHYDFEHAGGKKFILSELVRYMFFGFMSLPAVYIALETHIDNEILRIIIGSAVSYHSISIVEAIFKRVVVLIEEWKNG